LLLHAPQLFNLQIMWTN